MSDNLYKSTHLQGEALEYCLLEAIHSINELNQDGLCFDTKSEASPLRNPSLMLTLMDTLKIDLFWHDEYNGVEQSVVEADCTLAGPIREASEADAVAADVMTAVYRAVVIYSFGNEVSVSDSIAERSTFHTGIHDGNDSGEGSASAKKQAAEQWVDWKYANQFVGKNVLIRFENGHIEDATIYLDGDGGAYYVLFDGEALISQPTEIMLTPERGWKLWNEAQEYINQRVLVRFSSGHVEDAEIFQDTNGALLYRLYDDNDISEAPVAAIAIPASNQKEAA